MSLYFAWMVIIWMINNTPNMLIRFQTIFPDSMVPGRVLFSSNSSWQNNSPSALFSQRRENFFKHTNLQSSQAEEAFCARPFLAVRHCPVTLWEGAALSPTSHLTPTMRPTQKFPSTFQMPSWGMTLNHQADNGTRMTKSPKGKLRVWMPCWDCCG